MAAILAAAAASATTGLFGKSSSLSAYNIHHVGNGSTAAASSSSNSTPGENVGAYPKPFIVGLWKLVSATHRTSGTDVTVWTFEKRFIDRLSPAGKEQVIASLKREASSLSRFRHPTLLNIVEPLEETRGELTWVSEAVTSSLASVLNEAEKAAAVGIKGSGVPGVNSSPNLSIDEVEIQKGVLQVTQALAFLHKAKLVHLNVNPEAILINPKGDWKLSGLTHATPLLDPSGQPTKYIFPDLLPSLPPQTQWKLDYLDPVYALDSHLSPTNDLYSLGCVLYALHMGGRPPWRNSGRIGSLRTNAEDGMNKGVNAAWRSGRDWESASAETKDLLTKLITRTQANRISEASLPNHPYFRSLAVSILNYLEPTTFSSKSREEKSTFLQGLSKQIPSFSERLRTRKILPSLIEQTRDTGLLGLLIPAITEIARTLPDGEFEGGVLRPMAGLFGLRDPPQALLALLDLVPVAQVKATRNVFQTSMMPLIYNALESEHPPVQEKALQIIPLAVDSLDVSNLQDVLLVKIAILFSKTKLLAIKVGCLACFLSLVPVLDKAFLTTKLVPLLARIKTKEPTVVLATLRLHEAMGFKVDYSAVAGLILPQLWTMSTAPTLSLEQYQFFVRVIRNLGDRVEREHTAHLRGAGQVQSSSTGGSPSLDSWTSPDSSNMTFEKLLGTGTHVGSDSDGRNGFGADSALGFVKLGQSIDPWGTPDINANGFDAQKPGMSSSFAVLQHSASVPPTQSRTLQPIAPSPHRQAIPTQGALAPLQQQTLLGGLNGINQPMRPMGDPMNPINGHINSTATQVNRQSAYDQPSLPHINGASTAGPPGFSRSTPGVPFPSNSVQAFQPRPAQVSQAQHNHPPPPPGWDPTPPKGMVIGMGMSALASPNNGITGLMQPLKPAVRPGAGGGPQLSMKEVDWSDFDPLK